MQIEVLKPHFDLAEKYNLPMKFYLKQSKETFRKILRVNRHKFCNGFISCYEGDEMTLNDFIEDGLSVSISGCTVNSEKMC